ncbi:thiamine phosphate synthase [Myxococcota bacterium]|nr:thiamine phosphate synthase [Myxococcota bacterium]
MTVSALDPILPIVDVGALVAPGDVPRVTRSLLAAGARWLQLRAKHATGRQLLTLAREVRRMTRDHGALFVLNDRPDIAVLADADGVHLGQSDLPARDVRPWLPASMFIGVSCHSPRDVEEVQREGLARYVGYGPIFATATKRDHEPVVGVDGLAAITRAHPGLHVVAIGGLQEAHVPAIARAGAGSAAMISALLSCADPGAALARARAAFVSARAGAPS